MGANYRAESTVVVLWKTTTRSLGLNPPLSVFILSLQGDWALDRFAAVFLQGTEGVTIENCTFERLDGNAVMVSGYNRNATISDSDFSYIGGNAIAAWVSPPPPLRACQLLPQPCCTAR